MAAKREKDAPAGFAQRGADKKSGMSTTYKVFLAGELAFMLWLAYKSATATEHEWAAKRKIQR